MLKTKNNAGIIGNIEVMQHYIKPSFANNTQYATKFFSLEVKCTWISSFLIKFKPIINYYLFRYINFAYSSKKLLN